MTRNLAGLLTEIGIEPPDEANALTVTSLAEDSRQVEPGSLFVAIEGLDHDGHDFIGAAGEAGAVAAVGQKPMPASIPYFIVPDSRRALAQLAAAWYGHPADELVMIGVTGTDGKTTTVNLLFDILTRAGLQVGMITTVNAVIGDQVQDTGFHVTTPSAMQVQRYLAQMVEAGMSHCLIEATSHGLAQSRVGACHFDLAIITNITHEHLDFHGSLEAYRQAKASLFRQLDRSPVKKHGQAKVAILNRDDASYELLSQVTRVRQVSYGVHQEADMRAEHIESTPEGIQFELAMANGSVVPLKVPLLGSYNAWNCMAAFSAAVAGLGVEPQQAAESLAAARAVPGRMESIRLGQEFQAIVDFAHTPNALRQALTAASEWTAGRVIAIFGSAGLRDREKRRLMAEASAELADITILTAEDPRTESLEAILEEMAAAAEACGAQRGQNLFVEPDRGQAMRRGLELAEPADLVIACGKGHEQSMCFGTIEYPWDDRIAMRAALTEYLGVPGPPMPELPTSPSPRTS